MTNENDINRMFVKVVEATLKTSSNIEAMSKNLKEMNDQNILHHAEVNKNLKILNSWVMKAIFVLITVLSLLAGIKTIGNMFGLT